MKKTCYFLAFLGFSFFASATGFSLPTPMIFDDGMREDSVISNPEKYELDLDHTSQEFKISHPNHAICHIQLIVPNKNIASYLAADLVMISEAQILPLYANYHGIESGVGSHWFYVGHYTLKTRNGLTFRDVITTHQGRQVEEKYYVLPLACDIPAPFKQTH